MKKIALVVMVLLMGGLLYAQDITRNFLLTIPLAQKDDLIRYIGTFESYQEDILNPDYCPQAEFDALTCTPLNETQWIPNPESDVLFAVRILGEQYEDIVQDYLIRGRVLDAEEAARAQAEIDAQNITVE